MSPAILNDIFASRATAYNLHHPVSLKGEKFIPSTVVLKLYPI